MLTFLLESQPVSQSLSHLYVCHKICCSEMKLIILNHVLTVGAGEDPQHGKGPAACAIGETPDLLPMLVCSLTDKDGVHFTEPRN